MPACPQCQHSFELDLDRELDQLQDQQREAMAASLQCPKCGHQWTSSQLPGDDPMATLPEEFNSGMATLASPSLPTLSSDDSRDQPAGLGPHGTHVASDSGQATIDLSTVADDSMATLDVTPNNNNNNNNDSNNATIDSHSNEPTNAQRGPHGTHVAEDSSQATLDIDAVGAHSIASAASTSDPDATRDLDPLATANFDLTFAGDATLDSTNGSVAQQAAATGGTARNPIDKTRRGTVAEDHPLTSIGTQNSNRSPKHVSVSSRKILSQDEVTVDNPDYRLLHKLGEGAMGVVYAARQCSIDRIVAIKAIKKLNEGQRDSREKFLYEAQITGDLDHPNIVPIHELGENDDGTLFYAMKMVSGTPWQKVIQSRTREENVETLMKVADAIAFAHSKRVIHRDLKPENIMLGSFGEVLVMDWGLAVPLDRNMTFGLGGTPAYMAPEMASHNLAKIGPASDIYLLGAILFQIVTGMPPHPGTTGTECLLAAVRNRIIDITVDDGLLRIARRAMESEPNDRYGSVIDFQEAIREYKRHSESIAITGRSRGLARQAKEKQDYEGFARAIFGFQDALVLWPENAEAQQGMQKAKLEYARCALAKNDFDLCIGTLDGITEPHEAAAAELRAQAEQAKQARIDRERRFVLMRRVLAAVVLFAVTSLSGLSLFLYSARNTILTQNTKLEKQRSDLEVANRSEQTARVAAESARSTAEAAAKSEAEARQLAERSLKAEQEARAQREIALRNEQAAKAEEVKQRLLAQSSAEEAVLARNAEAQAAQAARRSALLARLGEYQTGLNLAMSQTARNDLAHSQQQLGFIAQLEKGLDQPAPLLNNWLYRRVRTLNNGDLPQGKLEAAPTCSSSWPWLSVVALGDQNGNVYLQTTTPTTLASLKKLAHGESGRIVDLALAPDARHLISLHQRVDGSQTNLIWDLTSSEKPSAQPLAELSHANWQLCEFSPDGRMIVAGNSGGLAIIPTLGANRSTGTRRLPMKGKLLSLAWQPGTSTAMALALVEQTTDERLLYSIDLKTFQANPAYLPAEIAAQATCIACTAQGDALLGDKQGRVFQLPIPSPSESARTGRDSPVPTVEDYTEIASARQFSAIYDLQLDDQDNLLIRSDSAAISTWRWQPELSQCIRTSDLLGLMNNVRAATWLHKSQSIIATDERGSIVVWNVNEQGLRRRTAPVMQNAQPSIGPVPIATAAIDEAAQRVTTIDRDGALQRWQLGSGQIESLTSDSVWSYVGHTPGAQLHDWSIDRNQGILATSCRLPADAKVKLLNAAQPKEGTTSFEFCVWDLKSGNMRSRWQFDLSSGGRIAVCDSAKKLIVTDAERTICFDIAKEKAIKLSELPFGAALVVPNPIATQQVMLLRATGAGLMWDVTSSASPSEPSRDFNLAAANRFVPLDGIWESSGKRFYCLLENGQIGRFLWDGRQLRFDRLSLPNKDLVCRQQTQPWQCVDLELPLGSADLSTADPSPAADELSIIIRQRNQDKADNHKIVWSPSAEQPSIQTQQVSLARLPNGQHPADLCLLANDQLLLFDEAANAFQWNVVSKRFSGTAGRTELVQASADQTGNRWIVLGQQDQLWQVNRQANGQFVWQRQPLPLTGVQAVQLSADGNHLLLRHQADRQASQVCLVDLRSNAIVKRWQGASTIAWHAQRSLMACVLPDKKQVRLVDLESGQDQTIDLPNSLDGKAIQQLQFFCEAWSTPDLPPRWWLMVLSKQSASSKQSSGCSIDFVACPDWVQAPQWRGRPLLHEFQSLKFESSVDHVQASPRENIFVIGNASGTVAMWFATPSIAPEARELTTLETHRSSPISALQFAPSGRVILSAAENGEVFAWKAE